MALVDVVSVGLQSVELDQVARGPDDNGDDDDSDGQDFDAEGRGGDGGPKGFFQCGPPGLRFLPQDRGQRSRPVGVWKSPRLG